MPYKDRTKQKEAQARYFKENQAKLQKSQNAKRNEYRKKIQEIKSSTPCTDCGEKFPHYIMDFDHLPGTNKKFSVSVLSSVTSMEALEMEIEKCEVVCANCHRHRTFMRGTKS